MYDLENEKDKEKQLLSSALGKIKSDRDKAAHTSVSTFTSLSAPSFLKREFELAHENAEIIFKAMRV